jgi:phosphatidylcholine synthase
MGDAETTRRIARQSAGYAVHAFTASGAAVAMLALYAAMDGAIVAMFGWLALALFIDGVDGSFARAAKVKDTAPIIDGAVLDFVIDFLTYVVVPVVALWRSDLMPQSWSLTLSVIVVTASALYFSDTRMKTADNWFRGFPALWNVLVFYLFVFRPPATVSVAVTLVATAAMFAPVVFVHPMRVAKLRALTLVVCALWSLFAAAALWSGFATPLWARIGLAVCALYVLALPLMRASPWAEESAEDAAGDGSDDPPDVPSRSA